MPSLQDCRYRAGTEEPPHPGVPWRPRAPDRDAASSSLNLSSDPTSGSETPANAGFPPAGTPMVATSAAPPPPVLAGSSPLGWFRSCHPRVPLSEGWKEAAAVASNGSSCFPSAAGGAALSSAPASPSNHQCLQQLTTKETCDRRGQNTERHRPLANPSGRPLPSGILGYVVPTPGAPAGAAWVSPL